MKVILILLLIGLVSSQPASSTFTLSFQYAARQNKPFQTCLADVLWNNVIIASIVPSDYSVHTVTLEVTAIVGENQLQFAGAGTSDTYGFGFTNVKLIRQGDSTNTNIVINGDFANPKFTHTFGQAQVKILGWTGLIIQVGDANYIYNNAWPPGTQASELDSTRNIEMTQLFTFDNNFQIISNTDSPFCNPSKLTPQSFTLSFEWAPNTVGTSNLLTSQFNVIWNNQIIDSIIPSTSTLGVNQASYNVNAFNDYGCPLNILQFDGTQTNDGFGASISNVQLTASGTSNVLVNGNFQSPNVGTSTQKFVGGIPGWTAAQAELGNCKNFNSQWSGGQCISLDSGVNQRYQQTYNNVIPHKIFDIVGPLTTTAFGCLSSQSYSYAIVRADSHSIGIIDSNAVQTLQNAQAAGLMTSIYIVLCRGVNASTQISPIIQGIPRHLYVSLWFKVQPNNISGCSWDGHTKADNCQFMINIISQGYSYGVTIGLFTTSTIFNLFFDSFCSIIGILPLWYADYQPNGHVNPTQSFADFVPFGPWRLPYLKQTGGAIKVTLCNNPKWHALIDTNWLQ